MINKFVSLELGIATKVTKEMVDNAFEEAKTFEGESGRVMCIRANKMKQRWMDQCELDGKIWTK